MFTVFAHRFQVSGLFLFQLALSSHNQEFRKKVSIRLYQALVCQAVFYPSFYDVLYVLFKLT